MRTISSLSLACVLSFSAPLALALNSPAPNCLPPKCTAASSSVRSPRYVNVMPGRSA